MTKTIYIVTSGEYSDYGIDGVFDSKELAEDWISMFKQGGMYGDMKIEEHEINPNEDQIKKGRKAYRVMIGEDGEVSRVWQEDRPSDFNEGDHLVFYTPPKSKEPSECYEAVISLEGEILVKFVSKEEGEPEKPRESYLNVYCFADDEQHARKIASERRASMIALGEWKEETK